MHENKNLLDGSLAQYNDTAVPKIPVFAGNDITSEVYYFKPNQVLNAHRHPNGEQIFVFLKGEGKMKLGEHECDVKTAILYLYQQESGMKLLMEAMKKW